jgi:Iap family predicted aminopeptidase
MQTTESGIDHFRRRLTAFVFAPLFAATLPAAELPPGAPTPPAPHVFLERLCDDFGGRLTGSPANAAALDALAAGLRALGVTPEKVPFTMPGWERGADRVDLIAPLARPLRVAALSYAQAHAAFEADVVEIGKGRDEDYPPGAVAGRVGVLAGDASLPTPDLVRHALAHGLRGVLFTNREGGGQLLARTGGFAGQPLPLPIYSITQEEGRWLSRLLARGTPVRVRLETRSRCRPVETANLVVRLPGRAASRIVVGAHFDSWDLGQGAMDNGIGIAQLYALATALRGATLHHTIELVWFNGEEQGLWGSRHQAAQLGDAPIVAMVNLDMVGVPIAVNALGDDSLVPALERWHESRGERRLALGVQNINWVASDHTPYQLAGVRTITFNAPIPRESVRHYHDLADTIDKVPPKLIDDSAAIIGELVRTLAQDESLGAWRRAPEETEKLFTRFDLEKRLQAMGLWPFGK